MFKLKKKAFNTNRNNFARRIKTARIIKKLIIALKLGLPIRGKIKDCKFRWTTLAKIAPKKINPKTTSEPIKPKKNPHKVQNTKMSKKITSKKFVSITFANVCRLLKTIKQVITFTNKIQVQNSNYRVFMKKSISATIITLDEEDTLQTCIQNVTQLCDEVIVLDSYSKDKTTDIAKKLGAKVFFQSFLGAIFAKVVHLNLQSLILPLINPNLSAIISFLIILAVFILLAKLLRFVLNAFFFNLNTINRVFGGVVGFVIGIVLNHAFLYATSIPAFKDDIAYSKLAKFILNIPQIF